MKCARVDVALQSIMRKEVGSMALDELMHNRASLNSAICMGMGGLEESWGIKITRYEVRSAVVCGSPLSV